MPFERLAEDTIFEQNDTCSRAAFELKDECKKWRAISETEPRNTLFLCTCRSSPSISKHIQTYSVVSDILASQSESSTRAECADLIMDIKPILVLDDAEV